MPALASCPRALLLFPALLITALLLAACSNSDRSSLTVFAAASLSDVFEQVGARFQQQEGVEVQFAFGGSQRLRLQLEQGARADVFASADDQQMQRVIDAGLVAADPHAFAGNTLVLVVTPGAGVDGPGDLDGLRLVVAAPEVPAGRLTRAVLAERGESDLLSAVVSEEDNVRAVLTKVAVGEADAGYVYASDARSAGDDVRVFPLGSALRNRYLAAPLVDAKQATDGARFVAFLQEPFVQTLLREAGFEPGDSVDP